MHIFTSFTAYFTLFHQGHFVFVSKNIFLVISVFIFSFSFQFLDSPSQKISFFVCVCLDYSRTNEQILIEKLWVGPDRRKKLLKERSGSYFGYKKKIYEFPEVPIQCIFNDFGFLLDISMKINLHVWFYFIVFLTIFYIT